MLFRTDKFDALATDLDLDGLQQTNTNEVDPVGAAGQVCLQVHTVDEVTVA